MSLTIVALPNEDDYVWNVSSEKKPHLTILFLGDVPLEEHIIHIIETVSHAADLMLGRFGLHVDVRGTLGDDDADVLFFEKKYQFENIEAFRAQLLLDPIIRKYYESVDQFPEWTPHLTLGYPTSPAKKDTRDYPGTSYVRFNRIAVWTGDFEGPDFLLQDKDTYAEVAMSFKNVDKFLEHYGVKGMRWGVRKKSGPASADAQKHGANKKKKLSELNDNDLRDLVTRMGMEQNAKRLNPGKLAKGENAVKAILATGATVNAAIAFANSPAGKAIGRAMAKAAAKATNVPVDQIGRTK